MFAPDNVVRVDGAIRLTSSTTGIVAVLDVSTGTPGIQNASAVAAPADGVSQIVCAIPLGPVGPASRVTAPLAPPYITSPRVVIGLASALVHVIAEEPPPWLVRTVPAPPGVIGRLKLYAVVAPPFRMLMYAPLAMLVARLRTPFVVPLIPKLGDAVHDDAEDEDVFGTSPAPAADVALVAPPLMSMRGSTLVVRASYPAAAIDPVLFPHHLCEPAVLSVSVTLPIEFTLLANVPSPENLYTQVVPVRAPTVPVYSAQSLLVAVPVNQGTMEVVEPLPNTSRALVESYPNSPAGVGA